MNIIDIIIILCLLSAGYTGSRNGFIKQSVVLIGTIISFILAWFLKDIIANFLSYNLPFFSFIGPFEGLTALNIVLYQLISFIFLLFLFSSVLIILIRMSNILEKILKMTLVLHLPSKILGFILGLIEGYIIVFSILLFLNQPAFNIEIFNESKMTDRVINSSPGLSNIVGKMNNSINDIYVITKDYSNNKDVKATNKKIVNTLLKHKVINKDYVEKLKEQNKIDY